MSNNKDDYVVLLHGIGRDAGILNELESYLNRHDYETHNETYPSTMYSILSLAHHIYLRIQHDFPDRQRRIHFVAHSMGGILARVIISKYRPANLGRVVMIGPPNKGSAIIDRLKQFKFFHRIMGPAALQLSAEDKSFVKSLPPVDYDVGVIAGNQSSEPWFSLFLSGENDGKVTVDSTRLEGMKDHIVIPASHVGLVSHDETLKQVLHFLEQGEFER